MIKPMLAHKYDPQRATYPAYIQPKLDGVRCTISAKGAFSRTHKEFKNVDHIKRSLKAFFREHPYAILDGELYNHDLRDDFEKIISLVRKTKPTDEHRKEARKLIQFHCYDIVSYNGAISDGLKVVAEKDSGTAANTLTVSLIYYNGGPNMSDVTIAGIGSDPS